jgi:PKD repeat protein
LPQAALAVSATAFVGIAASFDGSRSQGATEFQFDFGDGTPVEITSSPTTDHTYGAQGPVHVCLRVAGATGKQSVPDCHDLMVLPLPPDAAPDAPQVELDAGVDAPGDAPADAASTDGADAGEDGGTGITGYVSTVVAATCADISAIGQPIGPLGDDDGVRVSLGFEFPFWQDSYPAIGVSSNGYLQLATETGPLTLNAAINRAIPDPRPPNNLIAVFWDDLAPPSGIGSAQVYVATVDFEPQGTRFVVQWSNWSFFGAPPQPVLTFQALLAADGQIELRYCQLDDVQSPTRATGGSATVGIEDASGANGVQHSFNTAGAVAVGTAIRFTPMR